MNELKVISEQEVLGKSFKIYGSIENPLFLAKDVAEWIDHSNVTEMVRKIEDEEKLNSTILSLGQNRVSTFLTEDGLYEVLMQSRKPKAKAFKKEIKIILKSIRVHGGYLTPEKIEEALLNPDVLINLATQLKTEQEARRKLEAKIEKDEPLVLFAKQLTKATTNILIGEFAKTLCDEGFDIGEKRLFTWLRNHKYLNKKNIPYQQYITNGAFQVKRGLYPVDNIPTLTITPVLTPKGQLYIFKKLKEDGMFDQIAA